MRRRKHIAAPFVETRSLLSTKTLYDDNNYVKHKLDNGLTLISQYMPHLKSIAIGAWVLVGSRYEKRSNIGISHFIEHSVFKGTKKRNPLQIAKSLENVGGSLNAFTSKEHTCYYANILSEDLPLAVDVISDLVTNATFLEKEIDKEKLVVIEEIKDTEDTPEEFIQDYFYSRVFPEHPLGHGILGTKETVDHFTQEQIDAYYSKYYVPSNIVVSVAGNFNQDELLKIVHKRFKFRQNTANRSYWPKGFEKYQLRKFKGERDMIEKNISQAHICMGLPIKISYMHNKKFELLALNTILGGGMSSRLFQKVRERHGLAYSIYSFVDFMYDTGLFGIYWSTDKTKLDKAVELVKNELKRMTSQPIKKNELKMAKSQIKANLLFGLESTSTRMIRLAKNEIYLKKKLNIADITEYIDNITLDDINEVAATLSDKVESMQVSILC
ncbi:insulinase family protein [bacterium]|nr:insulinase family protein [bacterium]